VPIAQDFHWPRAQVSGVLGLISLISAVVYPWVGRAMDRLGARTMLILGNLVFAASVAALALSRPSVPIFYGLFALVGVAGAFPSTAMFCKAVADWFDERRGLMLGVTAGWVTASAQRSCQSLPGFFWERSAGAGPISALPWLSRGWGFRSCLLSCAMRRAVAAHMAMR
jgi:MFS family permease